MVRASGKDADKYTASEYFGLKNDGDFAEVRFLYNSFDDIYREIVHSVKVRQSNGKDYEKHVDCLREFHEPVEKCPFCEAGLPQISRLCLQVYNIVLNKVQVWERSNKYFDELKAKLSRRIKGNLCANIIEISRIGEAGSMQTKYDVAVVQSDEIQITQLPKEIELRGKFILEKTAVQMNEYLQRPGGGYFMADDTEEEAAPVAPPVRRSMQATTPAPQTPAVTAQDAVLASVEESVESAPIRRGAAAPTDDF